MFNSFSYNTNKYNVILFAKNMLTSIVVSQPITLSTIDGFVSLFTGADTVTLSSYDEKVIL